MKAFFDERQLLHAPEKELHNGSWSPYQEVPLRAANIASSITDLSRPGDFGLDPILAVHSAGYIDFLTTAHQQWINAGRDGDAIGYTFPVIGRRPLNLTRIDAKLGAYSFDTATPIGAQTWTSAYWSAQTSVAAVDSLIASPLRSAFALCRPPGHHAGSDYLGGYCLLNNAAIAACYAQKQGLGPVAILDIDYHHGNGTQDIFYSRSDIYFASIHADPREDYPFYWGHADEKGIGEGFGCTANYPMPRGTAMSTYRDVVEQALDDICKWGAGFLVVSFGADTHTDDPISFFKLETDDYGVLGSLIASRGLQTVMVMEGGYATSILGKNVSCFLSGWG